MTSPPTPPSTPSTPPPPRRPSLAPVMVPVTLALIALAVLTWWLAQPSPRRFELRAPETPAGASGDGAASAGEWRGQLTRGSGVAPDPAGFPHGWPQYRGPSRTGSTDDPTPLARALPPEGPPVRWAIDVGDGYAGPAVHRGKVYLLDYDIPNQTDVLRCLSLTDGRDLWRYSYPVKLKPNHGMSRTVPAVNDRYVVTLGPKCHVVCLRADTGEFLWALDLVRQFGSTVPAWYAGQCPILDDGDRVILAPAGPDALLIAIDAATGKVLWKTPNPKRWEMTHASISVMEFAGQRIYLYPASAGVVAVNAADGTLLFDTDLWKIQMATVPAPVILPPNRILLAGGYNSGAVVLELQETQGSITANLVHRFDAKTFSAPQQTPIPFGSLVLSIRQDGQLAALDPAAGTIAWTSGKNHRFGLGPMLLAGNLAYLLNDTGDLTLAELSPTGFRPLATAHLLTGKESWGPLALSHGHLLARNLTRLICVDVSGP